MIIYFIILDKTYLINIYSNGAIFRDIYIREVENLFKKKKTATRTHIYILDIRLKLAARSSTKLPRWSIPVTSVATNVNYVIQNPATRPFYPISVLVRLTHRESRSDSLGIYAGAVGLQEFLRRTRAPSRRVPASEREVTHPLQVLISHHFQMTPPLRWVFLLALVGRYAASVPASFAGDACALLCHPLAESFPEGVCKLWVAQSGSDLDQARVIVSRCQKPCDRQLPFVVGVVCHALRSLLGDYRVCRCPSTDATMPSGASVPSLVNGLAEDVVDTIYPSALDRRVIRALRAAFSLGVQGNDDSPAAGCMPVRPQDAEDAERDRRDVETTPAEPKDQDPLDNGNKEATTTSSEEVTIDWEQWCMSQCNSGHGGNACRCDLIPWERIRRGRGNGQELASESMNLHISSRLTGRAGSNLG